MSKKSIAGATSVGVLSSIFAFLGVVSCCGLPLIAGALAWFGIGASQLSFFAEYRSVFIGAALVSLLFGFWQVYFRKNASCCSSSCCGDGKSKQQPKPQRFQKVCLWLGAFAIVLILVLGEANKPSAQQDTSEPTSVPTPLETSGCCSL